MEKTEIQRQAKRARMSLSAWVLSRVLEPEATEFERLSKELVVAETPSHTLAALSDFLQALTPAALPRVLQQAPVGLSPFHFTYVSAMVEHAAARKAAACPGWALSAVPLAEPYFASDLKSLRLHLLTSSPAAFRRRNLFVDASVGDRV